MEAGSSLGIIKTLVLSAKEQKLLCVKSKRNVLIVEMVRDREQTDWVKLFMRLVPIVKVRDTLLLNTMLLALTAEELAI